MLLYVGMMVCWYMLVWWYADICWYDRMLIYVGMMVGSCWCALCRNTSNCVCCMKNSGKAMSNDWKVISNALPRRTMVIFLRNPALKSLEHCDRIRAWVHWTKESRTETVRPRSIDSNWGRCHIIRYWRRCSVIGWFQSLMSALRYNLDDREQRNWLSQWC